MRPILFAILFCFSAAIFAAPPKVVVSISPIFALTQALMQNVGEPILLVQPGASPHSYALKPSQVSDLQSADLVIWVGESLETFLIKTIAQLPQKTRVLTLLKTSGLNPLHFRTDAHFAFESDHAHHGFDPHVWLDPIRTQILVVAMANTLVQLDPENKSHYQTNAAALTQQLTLLDQQLNKDLALIKDKPFIVFHDAYQYFEKRYGLNSVAAITLNPEMMPSAQHIKEIQDLIREKHVACIFAEPQFKPAIVEMIATGMQVKEGVLNPEGTAGFGFLGYQNLLMGLGSALRGCLDSVV